MERAQQIASLRRDLRSAFPSSHTGPSPGSELHADLAGLSTRLEGLDRLLVGQGLPRGRVSELTGVASSGKTGLALHIVGGTTRAGEPVAWIDLGRSFYPPSAVAAGIDMERLLLIRVANTADALKAADILLRGQAFPLVVFDWGSEGTGEPLEADLGAAVARLNGLCALSRTTLLFLTTPATARDPLRYYATLRLEVRREVGGASGVSPSEESAAAPSATGHDAGRGGAAPSAAGHDAGRGGAAPSATGHDAGKESGKAWGKVPLMVQTEQEESPGAAGATGVRQKSPWMRLIRGGPTSEAGQGAPPAEGGTPRRLVGLPMNRSSHLIAVQIIKNKLGPPGGRVEVGLDGSETAGLPLHSGAQDTGTSTR